MRFRLCGRYVLGVADVLRPRIFETAHVVDLIDAFLELFSLCAAIHTAPSIHPSIHPSIRAGLDRPAAAGS